MTIATTTHAEWSSHEDVTPIAPNFGVMGPHTTSGERTDPALADHMRRLMKKTSTAGDPEARTRLATLLHNLTGWSVFSDEADERAYVSRLWAEDWDSPEDSVYDD